MNISPTPKRLATLSLVAVAAVATVAAIGPDLSLRGTGTYCLTPEAARAAEAQGVTMEAIAPATATGTCVTLPGTGTAKANLSGGDAPLQGGMRFSRNGHRLDVTNLHIHVRLTEGDTSADFAPDGSPATPTDFLHYKSSPSLAKVTPTTFDASPNTLYITTPAAAAFTDTFGTSPAAAGTALFTFEGHAEIVNPLSKFPTP